MFDIEPSRVRRWRRQVQLDEELSRAQDRASGAREKTLQGYEPRTPGAEKTTFGPINDQRWQGISRRGSVADIASDGRQVANLHASKRGRRLGQGGIVLLDERM